MAINRRQLLAAGAVAGSSLLLAACHPSGSASPGHAASGPPRPGGTLRVGALGHASSISRNPHGAQPNESDYLILSLLYDTLTVPGSAPTVAPRLATRWEPSADLRRWRFELVENARFHDGTPLTSDDVVYSLRRLRQSPSGTSRLPGIQPEGIQPDGPHGVVVESDYPNNAIPLLMRLTTFILKNGTVDPAGAPGSGPFALDWFRDGNARLVRNENWHGGRPLLDAIEVRMFDKPDTMANAVLSGEIDLASNVGTVAARAAERSGRVQVVRRPHDTAMLIVMRAADGPFADVRVREAFRLAVDREALVRQGISGYGTVGNDVLGTADPLFAHDLPQRTRDLAKASALLDVAGFDRTRSYQLVTTEDIPGLAESATLFARQLRDVGVTIDVVKQDSSTFLGASRGKSPLYTTFWGTNDSTVFCAGKLMLSGASMNDAAWREPAFDDAYHRAVGASNPEEHRQLLHDMQAVEYERSGYLLWGMADGVDLARQPVQGLPRLPGYGRVQLERAWLDA